MFLVSHRSERTMHAFSIWLKKIDPVPVYKEVSLQVHLNTQADDHTNAKARGCFGFSKTKGTSQKRGMESVQQHSQQKSKAIPVQKQ